MCTLWFHAVQQDAESVLQEVFPCVVACRIREVEDRSAHAATVIAGRHKIKYWQLALCVCRIEDYTLQMTGEQSYIHGKFQLINFKDIRRY